MEVLSTAIPSSIYIKFYVLGTFTFCFGFCFGAFLIIFLGAPGGGGGPIPGGGGGGGPPNSPAG